MTGLLILNAILSVGIVLVIVGMHAWAIAAERRAFVGPKSRVTPSAPVLAPGASPSLAAH
jgi:hypothetical protein